MNDVTLIGNVGNDAELKELNNGKYATRISLCTNENYKDNNGDWQKIPTWHNVTFYSPLAERFAQGLKKGVMLHVKGKITYRKYTDKNGIEREATDIIVNQCHFVSYPQQQAAPQATPQMPQQQAAPQATPQMPQRQAAPEATQQQPQQPHSPSNGSDDLPF